MPSARDRAVQVHLRVEERLADGRAHAAARGQVHDRVRALAARGAQGVDEPRVADVGLGEAEGAGGERAGEIPPLERGVVERVEVVDAHHLVAPRQQGVDHVAADEPRRPRHDHLHGQSASVTELRRGFTIRRGPPMRAPGAKVRKSENAKVHPRLRAHSAGVLASLRAVRATPTAGTVAASTLPARSSVRPSVARAGMRRSRAELPV